MATNAIFDMLRQTESPAKDKIKVVQKDQLCGCVSQDSYQRKSTLREERQLGSTRAVKISKGTWHKIKIRKGKSPSRGIIQKCAPHERSLGPPNFGERPPEETLQQEGLVRKASWVWRKYLLKLRQCWHPLRQDQRSANS